MTTKQPPVDGKSSFTRLAPLPTSRPVIDVSQDEIPYRCTCQSGNEGTCPGCRNLEALETECAAIEHLDAGYVPIFQPKPEPVSRVVAHLKSLTNEKIWGGLAR